MGGGEGGERDRDLTFVEQLVCFGNELGLLGNGHTTVYVPSSAFRVGRCQPGSTVAVADSPTGPLNTNSKASVGGSKITPGFMMPFGSNARLMRRMTSSAGPCS